MIVLFVPNGNTVSVIQKFQNKNLGSMKLYGVVHITVYNRT